MRGIIGFVLIGLMTGFLGWSGDCLAGDPEDALEFLEMDVSLVPNEQLKSIDWPCGGHGREAGDAGDGMDGEPGDTFGLPWVSDIPEAALDICGNLYQYNEPISLVAQILDALILATQFQ